MSNHKPLSVEVLSSADADTFFRARAKQQFPPQSSYLGRPLHPEHRKMILADGFELKGSFGLTARDAESGEVEWALEQENLITDMGRQAWWDLGWASLRLGFAPSTETPNVFRCSVGTDGSQTFVSGTLSPTITPSTYTKQWSTTFGTPGANRTLGIIWTSYASGTSIDQNGGSPIYIWSYSLLTPPKTQTTTQTLEVVYKLSMNPIY